MAACVHGRADERAASLPATLADERGRARPLSSSCRARAGKRLAGPGTTPPQLADGGRGHGGWVREAGVAARAVVSLGLPVRTVQGPRALPRRAFTEREPALAAALEPAHGKRLRTFARGRLGHRSPWLDDRRRLLAHWPDGARTPRATHLELARESAAARAREWRR